MTERARYVAETVAAPAQDENPPPGQSKLRGAPPIRAEARAELLVVKSGDLFLCARLDGDVRRQSISGEGFYAHDTRYLSELQLSFGDVRPVQLSQSVESGHCAVVNATNGGLVDAAGVELPDETIHLRRTLLIADRLYCHVALHNFRPHRVSLPLTLWLAADFADVFEVRGVHVGRTRGRPRSPRIEPQRVTFGRVGEDGLLRETMVSLEPAPTVAQLDGDRVRVDWEIELDAMTEREVMIAVAPTAATQRSRRPFEQILGECDERERSWIAGCTEIDTDSELFEGVINASMRDLHALLMPTATAAIPAAGIPWYVAPFGRDSLLTAYECLLLNPQMARDTLRALACLQATTDEPWRDAEPGKILHEHRAGELARAGLIPHTPYYGTADATPLFVLLAAAYHRWSADDETIAELLPAIDAAIEWIDRYGDADGDGFVEYARRSPAGLANQGWKDSEDAIMHADGTAAEGPIALVEVQGYVYLAKLRIADVYAAFGQHDRARDLRSQAQQLRVAFNESFWVAEDGTFALALDGRKRQVASITSNPGHCLFCGIVDDDKAGPLADRLMAPDMFSGWGVRTLSASSPAYNPMSYHNGSVWPHDNAIVAAGLKRYGHAGATARIATALFDVAASARDFRLAELYCGFDRSRSSQVVGYPVACLPQAWAAAVPFMLLQAMLGVSALAPKRELALMQPELPPWLGKVELRRLRVGGAEVDLGFARHAGATAFSLLGQRGDIAVELAATPR